MISYLVLIPFVVVVVFLFAIVYVLKSEINLINFVGESHQQDEYQSVKVATYEDKAYWIINDQLFRAELDSEGDIDHSTTEAVDSMTIDFDEMPLLFNIVEALKQHGA